MHFHRKILAADLMFARPMEVHLHQLVGRIAQFQRAACAEIELNGVAVVDGVIRGLAPGQFQRRELALMVASISIGDCCEPIP
jgi:hypothetical protein